MLKEHSYSTPEADSNEPVAYIQSQTQGGGWPWICGYAAPELPNIKYRYCASMQRYEKFCIQTDKMIESTHFYGKIFDIKVNYAYFDSKGLNSTKTKA